MAFKVLELTEESLTIQYDSEHHLFKFFPNGKCNYIPKMALGNERRCWQFSNPTGFIQWRFDDTHPWEDDFGDITSHNEELYKTLRNWIDTIEHIDSVLLVDSL